MSAPTASAPPPVRSPATPLPVREMLLRAAGVLVVVALVAMAGLGVRALVTAANVARTADALATARTSTTQVLSYDAATLDADLAAARTQVTGEYARRFDGVAARLVEPAERARSVTTRAEVVRAAVISQRRDRVEALLYLDRTTRSPAEPEPRLETIQVAVTMTLVDGRWLISGLDEI